MHCSLTEERAGEALPWTKPTCTSHLLLEICSDIRGHERNTEKCVPHFPHQETYMVCTKIILKIEHVFQQNTNLHASRMSSDTGAKATLTPHSGKAVAAVVNCTGEHRGRLRTAVGSDCGFTPHV